jgi:hypothetical protein
MQIKTTMRYNLSHIKLAKIQNFNIILNWQDFGEETFRIWRWESKMFQPLWRGIWQVLAKCHLCLPFNPTIPLVGISSTEIMKKDTKWHTHTVINFNTIWNSKKLEATQRSTKELVILTIVYPSKGVLCNCKKEMRNLSLHYANSQTSLLHNALSV